MLKFVYKKASIFINHCSLGPNMTCSFGKNGIDLFRKLKHDSHEFIMPSDSNVFLWLSLHFHGYLILI